MSMTINKHKPGRPSVLAQHARVARAGLLLARKRVAQDHLEDIETQIERPGLGPEAIGLRAAIGRPATDTEVAVFEGAYLGALIAATEAP